MGMIAFVIISIHEKRGITTPQIFRNHLELMFFLLVVKTTQVFYLLSPASENPQKGVCKL